VRVGHVARKEEAERARRRPARSSRSSVAKGSLGGAATSLLATPHRSFVRRYPPDLFALM